MRGSTERILTTHTGSLPRPTKVREALAADDGALPEGLVREAIAEVVRRQREAGIDVLNDGEASKPSYATYVAQRLSGFGGEESSWPASPEAADFPEWGEHRGAVSSLVARPACDGEIAYRDTRPLELDIANLKAAATPAGTEELFMSAASPGVVTMFLPNHYYPTHEAYVHAVADAMKTEYDAIHAAGLLLQLDCPDLAAGRNSQFPDRSFEEWRTIATLHLELLNHATRDIPPEAMRMHACWGNHAGPHHRDVPLREIIDILLRARPAGLSVEGANPRHEHEWCVFEDVKLPEGKRLIPGVIDSTTNYIEHPELVAQRLQRYAALVGRENVIAGTDCGFATLAAYMPVSPDIAWAKLATLAEGAALASRRLFA